MQSEFRKRGKEIWEGKVKRNRVSLEALKKLPQVKKKKQTIVLRNERIRRAQEDRIPKNRLFRQQLDLAISPVG